jgi:peptidoglycan/LPS O-acetylase OafA/YrhL
MNKSIFEINNNGFDKRIDSLTSLRFLMILMIFLNHLSFLGDGTGNSIYDQYFHNPNMAVTFFFILSGFGLTYKSFLNKEYAINCHYNLKIGFSYAWKRMKKLYPLYIITMAAAIPFTLVVDFKSFGIMHGVIIDTIKFYEYRKHSITNRLILHITIY